MKERPVARAIRLGVSKRDAAVWSRVNKVIRASYRREMGIPERQPRTGKAPPLPFATAEQRAAYNRLRVNGMGRDEAIFEVLK